MRTRCNNRNNYLFISIINIGEFVERAFKRVRINYKKSVKEINIFFIYNYTKIRYNISTLILLLL